MMNITIYSTTGCPYCNLLKEYLTSHSFVFVEKLIDQDEAAKSEMEGASGGFLGVPFVVITKDDGVSENVIGFDKGKINSILGIQA
jgi:glutaredoxin